MWHRVIHGGEVDPCWHLNHVGVPAVQQHLGTPWADGSEGWEGVACNEDLLVSVNKAFLFMPAFAIQS